MKINLIIKTKGPNLKYREVVRARRPLKPEISSKSVSEVVLFFINSFSKVPGVDSSKTYEAQLDRFKLLDDDQFDDVVEEGDTVV